VAGSYHGAANSADQFLARLTSAVYPSGEQIQLLPDCRREKLKFFEILTSRSVRKQREVQLSTRSHRIDMNGTAETVNRNVNSQNLQVDEAVDDNLRAETGLAWREMTSGDRSDLISIRRVSF
jgi:hypothetical protein